MQDEAAAAIQHTVIDFDGSIILATDSESASAKPYCKRRFLGEPFRTDGGQKLLDRCFFFYFPTTTCASGRKSSTSQPLRWRPSGSCIFRLEGHSSWSRFALLSFFSRSGVWGRGYSAELFRLRTSTWERARLKNPHPYPCRCGRKCNDPLNRR